MAIARSEYLRDLFEDAQIVSNNPEIISALILNDALNGIRKAVLDIAESNRSIANELGAIADAASQT
jgi:hypothetical protein